MKTFVPKIDKPCSASWGDMKGDDKRRFCEHCQLHVHNLSAMTLREQRQVLAHKTSERVCVGYVMPSQEVKVVTPGQWLARQTWMASWRNMAAVFAALWSLVGVSCQTAPPPPPACTKSEAPVASVADSNGMVDGKMIAGGIMMSPPRPFWKRLLGLY